MKLEKLFIGLLLAVCFVSCSKDDEPGNGDDPGKNPNQPENNSSVTINPDGSTSTKAVFSPIDETTFYIDYVKYQIVDSHLEIIGYDPFELKGDVKPYASVKYLGTTYNTRIIKPEAFKSCETITSINIPNTVTKIWELAFYGCSALTTVYISDGVTVLGSRVFYYSALSDIFIVGRPVVSGFSGLCDHSFTIHVKAEDLDWFKSDANWGLIQNIVGDYKP